MSGVTFEGKDYDYPPDGFTVGKWRFDAATLTIRHTNGQTLLLSDINTSSQILNVLCLTLGGATGDNGVEDAGHLLDLLDSLLDLEGTLFTYDADYEVIGDNPFNAVRYVRQKRSEAFDRQLRERLIAQKGKAA